MKDELTAKMHAEFGVDAETDIKHKVWDAMPAHTQRAEIVAKLKIFGVDEKYLNKYAYTFPTEHPLKTEINSNLDAKINEWIKASGAENALEKMVLKDFFQKFYIAELEKLQEARKDDNFKNLLIAEQKLVKLFGNQLEINLYSRPELQNIWKLGIKTMEALEEIVNMELQFLEGEKADETETKTFHYLSKKQKILIFHYIFQYLGISDETELKGQKSKNAEFVIKTLGLNGLDNYKNSYAYSVLKNPLKEAKREQLQEIRNLFESVGLNEIAANITKDLKI